MKVANLKNSLWTAEKTLNEQFKRLKVDGFRIKQEQPKESKQKDPNLGCIYSIAAWTI